MWLQTALVKLAVPSTACIQGRRAEAEDEGAGVCFASAVDGGSRRGWGLGALAGRCGSELLDNSAVARVLLCKPPCGTAVPSGIPSCCTELELDGEVGALPPHLLQPVYCSHCTHAPALCGFLPPEGLQTRPQKKKPCYRYQQHTGLPPGLMSVGEASLHN